MMWRLNFLVIAVCLALNNSYMLYYICPMHTIFTCMVYASLGIAHQVGWFPVACRRWNKKAPHEMQCPRALHFMFLQTKFKNRFPWA